MGWDGEGWALTVLMLRCQFRFGLNFPFGHPKQLSQVVWDESAPEGLSKGVKQS